MVRAGLVFLLIGAFSAPVFATEREVSTDECLVTETELADIFSEDLFAADEMDGEANAFGHLNYPRPPRRPPRDRYDDCRRNPRYCNPRPPPPRGHIVCYA